MSPGFSLKYSSSRSLSEALVLSLYQSMTRPVRGFDKALAGEEDLVDVGEEHTVDICSTTGVHSGVAGEDDVLPEYWVS